MELAETLQVRLQDLAARQLLRNPDDDARAQATASARALQVPLIDASSNDYLGLASTSARINRVAGGSGSSRLIHGTRAEHLAAERALANWLGAPSALLFSSGYAANVGTLSALLSPSDRVHSDALNHASLIDGMRLSRAERQIYPHNDLEALRTQLREPCSGQRWVVSESYFSMQGDAPDIHLLHSICRAAGAFLVIDEAHALGVFGPSGAGLCAATRTADQTASLGLGQPDVLIGTLGKSLGLAGAFIAGSEHLRTYIWNRARSFVFSTATSPLLAAEVPRRVAQVMQADTARERLATIRRELLRAMPVSLRRRVPPNQTGPILPIVLQSAEASLRASHLLVQQGILTQAIRPPTVPPRTARLRLTLKASWNDDDVARLSSALRRLARWVEAENPSGVSETPEQITTRE